MEMRTSMGSTFELKRHDRDSELNIAMHYHNIFYFQNMLTKSAKMGVHTVD